MGRVHTGKLEEIAEWTRQPKVTEELMDNWVRDARVELRVAVLTNRRTATSGCPKFCPSTRHPFACFIP
jgi:hypothetical protein